MKRRFAHRLCARLFAQQDKEKWNRGLAAAQADSEPLQFHLQSHAALAVRHAVDF
jgi:hypothetical protein